MHGNAAKFWKFIWSLQNTCICIAKVPWFRGKKFVGIGHEVLAQIDLETSQLSTQFMHRKYWCFNAFFPSNPTFRCVLTEMLFTSSQQSTITERTFIFRTKSKRGPSTTKPTSYRFISWQTFQKYSGTSQNWDRWLCIYALSHVLQKQFRLEKSSKHSNLYPGPREESPTAFSIPVHRLWLEKIRVDYGVYRQRTAVFVGDFTQFTCYYPLVSRQIERLEAYLFCI